MNIYFNYLGDTYKITSIEYNELDRKIKTTYISFGKNFDFINKLIVRAGHLTIDECIEEMKDYIRKEYNYDKK